MMKKMTAWLSVACLFVSVSPLFADAGDPVGPQGLSPGAGAKEEVGEFFIPAVMPLDRYQLEVLRCLVADDSEAAALARRAERDAAALLASEPHPLEEIHYEGLVHTDPRRIATVAKLRDMADVAILMRYWQVSDDPRAAAALHRFILGWTRTYALTGNDVNENKFWPLLVAIEALGDRFDPTQRREVRRWVSELGRLHADAVGRAEALGNRYSKHVRLTAMAGRILERDAWIALAREGVRRFVEDALFADGTSLDLKRRDSLTYHASGLYPAVELAVLAGRNGRAMYDETSRRGASLRQSVSYLVPYAMGVKTRREWVHSKVAIDRRRAEAGLEAYRPGRLYDPRSALKLMELAEAFDPSLLEVVLRLTESKARRFPTWQTLMNAAATTDIAEVNPRVAAALERLDRPFDEAFAWWSRVYDADSGGCYYSLSAKRGAAADKRFGPDIEATSKLVNVLEWTGLLEDCSPAFKAGVVRYMRQRQDPDSGFFRDPQHLDSYTANTLDRSTGMAAGALRRCGGEPLYPLPIERTASNAEAAAHYAHLESADALTLWLDGLPWEQRIWTVGARLRAQSGIFQQLPEPKRTQLLKVVESYVLEKQHANGFFGSEREPWTSRLSGTYKLAAFLDQNGLDVPRAEAMAATVMEYLQDGDYRNTIVLYNTANVLNILNRCGADFDLDRRIAIVRRCTQLLYTMRAPDGGYVTHIDHPSPQANGKLLAADVVESNTNATGLAHKTRMLLIDLLTGRSGPHPHRRGRDLLAVLNASRW